MIWYICLVLAIISILASLVVLFDRSRGKLRAGMSVLGMALATFILYIPIFYQLYDVLTATFSSIINVLQVISLDADYVNFYDMIHEGFRLHTASRFYMGLLGVVHFMLPAISLLAAYNILIHYYASLKILFMNRHNQPMFIFSDCNEESLSLGESIRKQVGRCDLIFADESSSDQYLDRIDSMRAVLFQGSIRDMHIKQKKSKDIYYFCIDEDDKDLNTALSLIKKYEDQDKEIQKHTHIYVLTEQKDVDLMLDSTNKGLIDMQVVSIPERTAYHLLQEYPLYQFAGPQGSFVLLIGLGAVNEALLRTVCWCGQMGSLIHQKILVIGKEIRPVVEQMRYFYPGLFTEAFDMEICDVDTDRELYEMISEKGGQATYVSIDRDGDQETLETAIEARKILYRTDPDFRRCPPIFARIRNSEKRDMVSMLRTPDSNNKRRVSYAIIPFGDRETTFSYDALVQEPLDKLSLNVHLVYSDIFSEGDLNVEEALEQYNVLEVNKRSNRANAMHIRYKLAMLGLDYTDRDDAEEVDLDDYLDDAKLEILTQGEHDRWEAFYLSEGWTEATLDEVRAYNEAGLSGGRHNCALLKKHPYICPFDELPKVSEALGLQDSRIYDRELIRRIPDILHDRWNISGKKYKIIRREN